MSCLNPENEKPGGTISLEGSTCAPGSLGVLNLKTRTKHLQKTQSVSQLPLFSWRVAVVQPGTCAGLHPTKTAPRGQSTDRGHARGAPAARAHDGQPVRQSIVRTDRSAALLARSSKRGRAVVDPATLFNVTVRGHHRQMPVGYPGRDDAHPLCGAIRSDVTQSKPRGPS